MSWFTEYLFITALILFCMEKVPTIAPYTSIVWYICEVNLLMIFLAKAREKFCKNNKSLDLAFVIFNILIAIILLIYAPKSYINVS